MVRLNFPYRFFTTNAEFNAESFKANMHVQHPATPFRTKDIHDYLTKCNLCSDG